MCLIAGIGDVSHDKSVCLMKNGEVLSAIEEERLTRIKHGLKLDPRKYTIVEYGEHIHEIIDRLTVEDREKQYLEEINYCLKSCGHKIEDIDLFVVSSLFLNLPFRYKSVFLHHHVAHCASAFYPSPFKKSAILVVDGYGIHTDGKSETVMYAFGDNNKINVIDSITGYCDFTDEEKKQISKRSHMVFKNSIGVFYQNITILLDLGIYGEGKTMGLYSYGEDNSKFDKIRNFIEFLPDGKISIDNRGIFTLCSKWIEEAKQTLNPQKLFKLKADLAFKHQQLLEEMVIYLCQYLYKLTKCNAICLAGGVALNSVINGKIISSTPFKKIFVQPAAGDNGIAIGAAMYGAHALKNYPRQYSQKSVFSPFLGMKYKDLDIDKAVNNFSEKIIEHKNIKNVHEYAAELVSKGKIVGWFNNGSEIGPRALGNRTILADPRDPSIKDYLNKQVKHRESFRPYAPAVLEEKAHLYFEDDGVIYPALYMLSVVKIKKEVKQLIPAVTHVDGTARIQIVRKKLNPDFYMIISYFENITNLPIILNTSFNDEGEPIVETPEDAIKCFLKTKIDYLFINKRLFTKRTNL